MNTEKGSDLFLNVSNGFTFLEYLSEKEAIVSNDNFTHSIKRPKERTAFFSDIQKKGYRGLWLKTYFTRTCRKKTLISIYGAFVPEKIRLKIHSIMR